MMQIAQAIDDQTLLNIALSFQGELMRQASRNLGELLHGPGEY
jgi:hypothetical protein